MQGLWIYPENMEVLGVACKSLLKALKPRYQKIALFSPISGGCEGFGERYGLNPLEFHSAIDKQKALELVSAAQEELLFETILKRYDELQTTHDFVINLGYAPKFFLNALLDLNTILAKHLNAPIVAVVQTSLERLKAMHSHAVKKEAPFAVGLFVGEMLEKPHFLSASLCKQQCELEADLIESVLQTKSKIITPLAFQMSLEKKAKKQIKKVVLPESEDERILKAVHRLNAMGAVGLILLGDKEAINSQAKNLNLNLENAEIIDPNTSHYREEFAKSLYELRKSKGLSGQEAKQLVLDKTYFATMLVHLGYAHAMVSGVNHTTADTIRPALQIIKTKPGVSLVSSVFLMRLDTQVLVFGDCAIIPNPKELAEIAITSAQSAKQFNIVPKVALLSYATRNSAQGEMIDKINEAREIAQRLDPQLEIDGPLQFDASIDKSVAKKKMPNSQVAGQASVFIFPDLNAGNIAYKAVQRSAKAVAIGPILQGLNKPINDLSRGALVEDIINTVLISAIQAQD
ncbi:phosphate acetyltransferase [Helicobacter pylori]|nr:phosphate acetyltransferase [Helicobacter pylori]